MFKTSHYIVYPEGDIQEIGHWLKINQLVDLNGYPLQVPLPSERMIAYRVIKISTKSSRHTEERYYELELVPVHELTEFVE